MKALPHDVHAELHVPAENVQLQGSRQPQQEEQRLLMLAAFVTSEAGLRPMRRALSDISDAGALDPRIGGVRFYPTHERNAAFGGQTFLP
jgi:hypothetical protein